MNIKKFIARNNQEAIQMVKREMGPDAVILRTRTLLLPDGDLEGSSQRIEITAAMDYDTPEATSPEKMPMDNQDVSQRWRHLEKEIKEIKDALMSVDAGSLLRPEVYYNRELRDRYIHLRGFGLRPDIIRSLMNEAQEKTHDEKRPYASLLKESLSRVLERISVAGKHQDIKKRRIFSFVGPTGVGKTTTLAKLAALSAIKQGEKTAMITLDTFRIAAVAQLETYARIMGIPIEVAANNNDLKKAIRKHHDCDSIFIDTAGRSPNMDKDIVELKNLFRIPEKINHYLVLSATTRYQGLVWAEKRFGALPFDSYIFTKLDETLESSSMVNFLISRRKPVSYFTTGQQVPEDIEAASKKKLATLILSRMKQMSATRTDEVKKYGSSYRS